MEDSSYGYEYVYTDSDNMADSSYRVSNGIIDEFSSYALTYSGTSDSIRVIRLSVAGGESQADRIYENGNLVKDVQYAFDGSESWREEYEYDSFENPFFNQPFLAFGSGEQLPILHAGEKGYPNNVTLRIVTWVGESPDTYGIEFEYSNNKVSKSFYYDDNVDSNARVEYFYN